MDVQQPHPGACQILVAVHDRRRKETDQPPIWGPFRLVQRRNRYSPIETPPLTAVPVVQPPTGHAANHHGEESAAIWSQGSGDGARLVRQRHSGVRVAIPACDLDGGGVGNRYLLVVEPTENSLGWRIESARIQCALTVVRDRLDLA